MSFDTFRAEAKIIEKNEDFLREGLTETNYQKVFEDLLENYKKLFKVSRRVIRISDRSEKNLLVARDKIKEQQVFLKKAHQELKLSSEHRLRTVIEATPAAIIISQIKNETIIYANEYAGSLFALETRKLIGLRLSDFYVDVSQKEMLQDKLRQDNKVDHYQLSIKKNNGSLLWLDISLRFLDFNEQPCFLCSCNDITHLKEMNLAASRFVPAEYLSFLHKKSLVDIKLGDHVTDEMTVMFSDIRSFTAISEDMSPQQNFDFVNAYLGRVSPIVRDYNGFIVKYLGDGIMAIFPNSADDGVQAGISKLKQINLYNQQRIKKGYTPIKVGIALNTGHMMVGMVGEVGRMQGDAFSDNVNLTSRLESLTKFYHVSFIITAATREALKEPSKYNIRFLDKVQVKGKVKDLDIYEVFDSDMPDTRLLKQQTLALYEQAMKFYFDKDFSAAQALLLDVLQKNPNDKVIWYHLMNTTRNIDRGISDSWTGVNVMTSK